MSSVLTPASPSAWGPAGHFALFDENLVAALHAVAALSRSPRALANFLEGAGGVALERAGALLGERVP